tara:strand:+ start:4816 stop:6312 length:1497 start_codon:yes stop_codon:yes gene_type:complete
MDQTDFDVKNYQSEELLAIMGVLHDIKLTKADIVAITQTFIDKYDDKPIFKKFFFDVRKKLLAEKDNLTKESIFYDGVGAKKIDDTIVGDRYSGKTKNMDERQNVIAELRMPSAYSHQQFFKQGTTNPTAIQFITRTINFDSAYRTILDPSSVACPTLGPNSNKKLQSPTNYTINLNQPLKKTMEITLVSAEIPFSWWVFNEEYGTNYFCTDKEDGIPKAIPAGNYKTGQDIVQALNQIDPSLNLLFEYDPLKHKISIQNNNLHNIKIQWYRPSASITLCVEGGGVGQKIDYNLGFLLGFRLQEYIIQPTQKATGEALLDLLGPKYFLLSLDDFMNSKPNQDLVTMTSNKSNFSLPSYYNKETMSLALDDPCLPQFNLPELGCRAQTINRDLSSNLTQKQRYTVDQIKLAMTGKPADRYTSPASTDVLHRIPIPNTAITSFGTLIYTNPRPDLTKRIYFGPVNLSAFRVRLLNDKGYLVNLNNMDWSFSLQVKMLYQY